MLEDGDDEDVIPHVDEAKQKIVYEEEAGIFEDDSTFGFDARACSMSLAHINFTALRLLEQRKKQEDDLKVTDPLGLASVNSQLEKVLSYRGEWRKHSTGSKALLDPTNENFQPLYYLRNLHKHTSWEDLIKGRDTLSEDTKKDTTMHKKQELLNEYFDQFVVCHDTMGRVCSEIRAELASGNIDALVESYEEMVSKAVLFKKRGEESEQVISPPMIKRSLAASITANEPLEPPVQRDIDESSSVVKAVSEFTDFLSSLATHQNIGTRPLATSPVYTDFPSNALQNNFPQPLAVNLEEAGTEVIAQKLTDSVVGLAPKNQKKDGLVYHNVFRGKDLKKWVKSRITPFDDAATSVCQAMVHEGHLVKMRTSRRTSNAFLPDDHDLYQFVSKNGSTTNLPSIPPTNAANLPSSVQHLSPATPPPLSASQAIPNLGASVPYRTSASIVEMAHTLGLPDDNSAPISFPHMSLGITPSQTPTGTPISTPVHTPTLSRANPPQTSPPPPMPQAPSFPTLLQSTREKIHSYCKRIWEAVEFELQEAENPLPVLERAVTRIGKCFDTIHVLRGRDASTVEQVNKSVSPLADVMEKVVKVYVEKVGEKCVQDSKDALPDHIRADEATTILTTHIEGTLTTIRRIIAVASHHLSLPTASPHFPKLQAFSSLPSTWFFDTFLAIGCDPIHINVNDCEDGKSVKELYESEDEEKEGLYEGEGWCKGTYKRWDAGVENVKGWVELAGDCETLLSTFDHLYGKFEKVYSPLSIEIQEKAANLVQTVRSLEDIIANKYTRYHQAQLHSIICEVLYEEDPTEPYEKQTKPKREFTEAQPPVAVEHSSEGSGDGEQSEPEKPTVVVLPGPPAGPPPEHPLMRPYLLAVVHHLMVVHMETVSLNSTFRKRVLHDLLNAILYAILHSPSYPSRQAEVEYAVLLRIIHGKDGVPSNPPTSIADTTVTDTSLCDTTNFTNLSHSSSELPEYIPPPAIMPAPLPKVDSKSSTSSSTKSTKTEKEEKKERKKKEKEDKKKEREDKKKAKSEKKKGKKEKDPKSESSDSISESLSSDKRTESYSSTGSASSSYTLSNSASISNPPSRTSSIDGSFSFLLDRSKPRRGTVALSRHRSNTAIEAPLQIVVPPLSSSFHPLPSYDHDIQADVEKAIQSIAMILECLDADW